MGGHRFLRTLSKKKIGFEKNTIIFLHEPFDSPDEANGLPEPSENLLFVITLTFDYRYIRFHYNFSPLPRHSPLGDCVILQLSQKNKFLSPRRGRIKVGGERSTMSTPIPPIVRDCVGMDRVRGKNKLSLI